MTQSFFSTQYPVLFVIFMTIFLIYKDHSFDTVMRVKFYSSFLVILLLLAFGTEEGLLYRLPVDVVLVLSIVRTVLYPVLLLLWNSIFLHGRRKKLMKCLWFTGALNAVLCLSSF